MSEFLSERWLSFFGGSVVGYAAMVVVFVAALVGYTLTICTAAWLD